jgi:AraC-like DNA-binding protein
VGQCPHAARNDLRTPRVITRATPGAGAGAPVVILVTGRVQRLRLTAAVRGEGEARTTPIRFVDRVAELQQVADAEAPALLVSEAADVDGTPTDACIASLRARDPGLVVVGYVATGATLSRQVLALAGAGVHELVFDGAAETAMHVRSALRRAGTRAGATRVMAALQAVVPGAARPIVRHVLEHAATGPRVGDIARALGVHRRTLVHRMQGAALPPPGELAMWARLLLAAEMLQHGHRTVDDVAFAIGFPGANAFRNACRRHLGVAPSALREGRGFALALERFAARMAAMRRDVVVHDVPAGTAPAASAATHG